MSEIQRIHLFLRAIRRRAHLETWLRVGGITLSVVLASLLVLALCATSVGPAHFWPSVTATVLLILTLGGVAFAAFGPARALRSERRLAQLVGRRHPAVASDLLSAVELARARASVETASVGITEAFFDSVGRSVAVLDVRKIIPLRAALQAAAAVIAMAAILVGGLLWAPGSVRHGLGLLLRHPTLFEGASPSAQPLIGDVRLIYTYPAYTGLPKRVVEGSTGDVVALKGTQVTIETHILRSARQASLLLGDAGERGQLPAVLDRDRLTASLMLQDSGSYRVWLAPLIGRPVRELRPHRIVAESDQAPRVDIFGAADRLELASPRPVEVGFSATDDFGLGPVDLVYRVGEGPEQRVRLRDPAGARATRGSTVFEPAVATLGPGEMVAYHIEAKDRDDVSGAKVGSSRTLYLVIQNPRENLDEQLARERDILDRLIGNLGDRLDLSDSGSPAGSPPPPGTAPNSEPLTRLASWVSVHEAQEAHLALLGRVVDDERRAGNASKTLVNALAGVADRLGKVLREESALLSALRGKADQGALTATNFGRVAGVGAKDIDELERSILLLDDLISRQRLEDLAAAARELTDAYRQLQDLAARYASTHDEALRREIERKIRDLRARIDELGQKIAAVKARNEVSTEWQNMPDMKEMAEQAQKLDSLLEKGDSQSLAKALSELGGKLGSLKDMLDKNANDFESERFPQENKALGEFMKKVEDLEGDERALAGDSQTLASEMDEELTRKLKGQLDKMVSDTNAKIDRLRDKLATAAPRDLDEEAQDDHKRAKESSRQLKRLVNSKDWGESKKEAERVSSSLRRIRRALDERTHKTPPPPAAEGFGKDMGEAGALAQEISAALEKLVPNAADRMSPEQAGRGKNMAQRQSSLQERSEDLAKEAAKKAGQVPGMDKAESDLKGAAGQMQESGADLQRGDAKEGTVKARDAADRLAQLREGMKKGQPMGRSNKHQDPVRIPGADDSKAPREWRQELMDAMREKAPDRFRDEVRRYYEELVK